MSEFDKFFADRLNEEGQFPQRDKNWKSLSKRLDAFDAGLLGRSRHLRYWQAAAAVLLIGASVLFGKVLDFRYENAELRRQLVELKEKSPALHTTPAQLMPVTDKSGIDGQHQLPEKPALPANPAISDLPVRNSRVAETTAPVARLLNNQPVAGQPAGQLPGTGRPKSAGVVAANGENLKHPAPDPQKTAALPAPGTAMATGTRMDTLADQATAMPSAIARIDLIPTPLAPVHYRRKETLPAETLAIPATPVAPVIKPLRTNMNRFRVGITALAGKPAPQVSGISTITGAGISAEMAIWKGIRAGVSADMVQYKVKLNQYVDRFHLPDPPSNPGPPLQHKLTKVEGDQKSQQLAIGVAYTVPLRFLIRPAFRIAHSWVKLPETYYVFELEDKDKPGHPPKYVYFPRRSKTEWFSNNWRLGAGLEVDSPRWTLGVWADYSKNLAASEPLFDAFYLRACLQYRFN